MFISGKAGIVPALASLCVTMTPPPFKSKHAERISTNLSAIFTSTFFFCNITNYFVP